MERLINFPSEWKFINSRRRRRRRRLTRTIDIHNAIRDITEPIRRANIFVSTLSGVFQKVLPPPASAHIHQIKRERVKQEEREREGKREDNVARAISTGHDISKRNLRYRYIADIKRAFSPPFLLSGGGKYGCVPPTNPKFITGSAARADDGLWS